MPSSRMDFKANFESFCLDLLSDFCSDIEKGYLGEAQNDVSVKITTQDLRNFFFLISEFKTILFKRNLVCATCDCKSTSDNK